MITLRRLPKVTELSCRMSGDHFGPSGRRSVGPFMILLLSRQEDAAAREPACLRRVADVGYVDAMTLACLAAAVAHTLAHG
jgi:hypothetical protein